MAQDTWQGEGKQRWTNSRRKHINDQRTAKRSKRRSVRHTIATGMAEEATRTIMTIRQGEAPMGGEGYVYSAEQAFTTYTHQISNLSMHNHH